MNTENCRTNESNKFLYEFTDKLNLKNLRISAEFQNMALANLSIYYKSKNIKFEYNNNNFKISALTWNNKFNLSYG